MQYDVGFQRQCWHIHLLTHWMGDEGWVKRASAQYRRFVYHSDVVRLHGSILRKFVDDEGEHCVEVATTSFCATALADKETSCHLHTIFLKK